MAALDHSADPDAAAPTPPSVWLCAPQPGQDDPPWPRWATLTVEAFSTPGDRVIIRSLGGYPSLPGEMAALISAAAHGGRRPVALLPTPAGADRTRHLAATVNPPGVRPRVVVGVGRRRPGREAGAAALVVALAGAVQPGARPPGRRHPLSAHVLAAWASPLRAGGVLAVHSPPPLGRRPRPSPAALITAAQQAGLTYTQHIVLVHVPAVGEHLQPPPVTRRPHAPFWLVHTDLWVFTTPTEPTEPIEPEDSR
jgi:hypothetical protein